MVRIFNDVFCMRYKLQFQFILLLVLSAVCFGQKKLAEVHPGAMEFFDKHIMTVTGMRVGLICNRTSVMPDGKLLVDRLLNENVNVTALFSPEHGIRGDKAAGADVESTIDPRLGIPVYSLYGKNKKPTKEMLENVDVLMFDIQDVGARFYTYISTMALAMQAAAENKKHFIVLDRPNPINGNDMEGPLLDSSQTSFVGMFPMPMRTGLTIGEIARLIKYVWWKNDSLHLEIIPMEGWTRDLWYDQIALAWSAPSPNIKSFDAEIVYPGTCLFEATSASEGRGTDKPFQNIGAPWIDGNTFAAQMNKLNLPGVTFDSIRFTPVPDSIAAPNPKFSGKECGGVFIRVTDRTKFKPVLTSTVMITTLMHLYPDSLIIQEKTFDRLSGSTSLRLGIQTGNGIPWQKYQDDIDTFKKSIEDYLIY